jgi:hypothetical protein
VCGGSAVRVVCGGAGVNARGVSSLAGVIHAAMQTHSTAAGIAMAVDAAGLLMSPETAAEIERLRASATGAHRRIEEVLDYLATKDAVQLSEDAGVMGFHIVAVLDGPGPTAAERAEQRAKAAQQQADYAEAVATVARLEQKRVELERIANAEHERVAELEQQLAVRSFYLADSEDAENGPTLHTTADAAKAWCDEVEPGDWFEDEGGVWVQCDTDPDTDRPTTRGAGTVTPLTVQGDGIVAEAERIRQALLEKARKLASLTEVRESERDFIRELQVQQGEVMKALGCGRHDEWDDVVHRARQLATKGGAL